ncbi:hypothetical protein EST38_g11944 [Candolleomyces aberdarensis]|uniref:F-box domain-containing protein n=1 Tax=Candolleomyces aberdarensis TaxID=2316362 RepID=A0A4Q2D5Y1_9AGAR|nr:hypothetical protein EST38_g11944 [Candolleomyces aberdarensis]
MAADTRLLAVGILHLPIELHLSITHHLAFQPQNFFSLLKTCRILHTVYSQKCIWDTALQLLCRRDALFSPSYSIQSMTVSQLQRAVMGPDLWNSRLRARKPFVGPDVYTEGTFTQLKHIDDQTPAVLGECKSRVYLVPGGRHLFEQAHNVISLWDLGMPKALCNEDKGSDAGKKSPSVSLIDRLEVSEVREPGFSQDPEFTVHQSSDGKRLVLLIAATAQTDDTDRYVAFLYRISPEKTPR